MRIYAASRGDVVKGALYMIGFVAVMDVAMVLILTHLAHRVVSVTAQWPIGVLVLGVILFTLRAYNQAASSWIQVTPKQLSWASGPNATKQGLTPGGSVKLAELSAVAVQLDEVKINSGRKKLTVSVHRLHAEVAGKPAIVLPLGALESYEKATPEAIEQGRLPLLRAVVQINTYAKGLTVDTSVMGDVVLPTVDAKDAEAAADADAAAAEAEVEAESSSTETVVEASSAEIAADEVSSAELESVEADQAAESESEAVELAAAEAEVEAAEQEAAEAEQIEAAEAEVEAVELEAAEIPAAESAAAEAEVEAEAETKSETETETEAGPEAAELVVTEVEPEAEVETKSELEAEAGPEVVELVVTEVEPEAEVETKSELEAEAEPEAVELVVTEVETKSEHEAETEAEPEVIELVVTEVETEVEVETKADPEPAIPSQPTPAAAAETTAAETGVSG